MKSLLTIMYAMISLGAFSSTKTVDSLVFSGEKYFSICGTTKSRINNLYDRFNKLCLTTEAKKNDVNIKELNHSWCIFIKDQLLLTVTKDDAKLHNSNPKKLAKKWAEKIANNIENIKPIR